MAAFDEEGLELLSRRVTNDPEALRAIFAQLGGDAKVALEAAFGWEWLADLLEGEGIELHLAGDVTRFPSARHLASWERVSRHTGGFVGLIGSAGTEEIEGIPTRDWLTQFSVKWADDDLGTFCPRLAGAGEDVTLCYLFGLRPLSS